jgi:hypothetical protein
MLHHAGGQAYKGSSPWAHLVAIIMPFTMVVLVPFWLHATRPSVSSTWIMQLSGIALFIASLSLFIATIWLFVRVGRGTLAP